ncbi:MAG: xanthine dehydrogenase small subunit, partial [Aestuariibacter sp.]|nr:xanthine dehydrogenase small subunit [Aestuariibacter sp.]
CTVVLGELVDGSMQYRAVNSCILLLPTLHGKQLITVEDLASKDGTLHPVQQSLVNTSGSQCGFCTPGFVMSMFAMKVSENKPNRSRINDVLAGNLCRCTGYRPIVEACEKMYDEGHDVNFAAQERRISALLDELQSESMVVTGDNDHHYFAPATVDDLARVYANNPDATVLAGGTDVGLWVTKTHRDLGVVIYLGRIKELKKMKVKDNHLEIGAGVVYTDAWTEIAKIYPDFGELIRRIGSTQVRNAGTIGGNVANGSPVGDTSPAMIAIGAKLILRKGDACREADLESFFIDYGKQDRAPGEFIEMVKLPLPKAGSRFRSYKVSKRFDQDISAACGAFLAEFDGDVVSDIRICFGGMAGIPLRAKNAEAMLRGKNWTEENVRAAMAVMDSDYTPLSDMRASKHYRSRIAQNLLFKFFVETSTTNDGVNTRIVGDRQLAHV